ncbi:MAG: glycosyltransferase [Candidatus Bathyarchaeia archaeon]
MDLISIVVVCFLSLLYFWVAYNMPIIATGIQHMRKTSSKNRKKTEKRLSLPTISIVVPVKNEEKVIGRLLDALVRLDYPPEKKEIILVEDGSTDRTSEICKSYAQQYPKIVNYFHRVTSKGKPSALNFGFKHAKGEIVAVFDSDNVPEHDVLMKAVKYFEDPSVAAVQGTTCVINADQNMLTKFVSYEEAVWLKNYLQGKDILNLFVPLTGSCQFIRKDVAVEVGLWDEDALAEDLEMSARITEKGYNIRFAPEIVSWQEAPSKLSQLIKQRVRWFRGYMEVAVKYGRFLKKMEKKTFDAEITLIGPYVLASFLLSYFASIYISLFPFYDNVFLLITRITMLLTVLTLLIGGIALVYATKPIRIKNILWLPFIYVYWSLQCLLTSYAFLQIIFRRPRRWEKTEKTGIKTQNLTF